MLSTTRIKTPHHSKHERILKRGWPHGACMCNFHRLWAVLALAASDSWCRRVSSQSRGLCHLDSSWIRLDCDCETFFSRRVIVVVECRRGKRTEREKSNQVVWKVSSRVERCSYHWIDGTWWFTTHVKAIVLPTFTWISAEPTILANFTARTQAGRKANESGRRN